MKEYRICRRCIMDTTDPDITFNQVGICSHCTQYDKNVKSFGYKGAQTDAQCADLIRKIKEYGRGKKYDCILGISGGVDSAYMAYLAKKFGLRVLAVHVDAGWNTEVAVSNIQKMCRALDMELHTIVVDWPSMKELQRAYMFSGLPNLDVPQDHVFHAAMYGYARKYRIKYLLNGGNLATEGILPAAWGYAPIDFKNIKSVYRKNGRGKRIFHKYPHFGMLRYLWYRTAVEKVNLLNYVPYSQKTAMETLEREFGWQYYGGKHFESRFTRFFQAYYLPEKFGYDKKRAHLSSLVVGGELSRQEALDAMEDTSAYPAEQMIQDRNYILKKLDISLEQWEEIIKAPSKSESDYQNNQKILRFLVKVKRLLHDRGKR